MVKVYTRTGDDGTTHCFKSGRISKDDNLIEAIGSVDELNSHVGLLASVLEDQSNDDHDYAARLAVIQSRLFDVGGALATYSAAIQFAELIERIKEEPLEKQIDEMDAELSEIKQFILPGGTLAASQTHICRAVCRRAERNVVTVSRDLANESAEVADGFARLVRYLNRLSDYFFVLSRFLNKQENRVETFWGSGETDN